MFYCKEYLFLTKSPSISAILCTDVCPSESVYMFLPGFSDVDCNEAQSFNI